jgi:hypothetical protein
MISLQNLNLFRIWYMDNKQNATIVPCGHTLCYEGICKDKLGHENGKFVYRLFGN